MKKLYAMKVGATLKAHDSAMIGEHWIPVVTAETSAHERREYAEFWLVKSWPRYAARLINGSKNPDSIHAIY